MNHIRIVLFIFLSFVVHRTYAQMEMPVKEKERRFSLNLGVGPSYYFNNLVTGKDLVNEWSYAIVFRGMWEPEHFLSLGFETGYYQLYTASSKGNTPVKIVNYAIPIHLLASMNIVKKIYFDFGMGPSILHNKVHTDTEGDFNGSSMSLADFSAMIRYRFNEKGRWHYSIGPNFFYSSHLNDKNLSLLFLASFKL